MRLIQRSIYNVSHMEILSYSTKRQRKFFKTSFGRGNQALSWLKEQLFLFLKTWKSNWDRDKGKNINARERGLNSLKTCVQKTNIKPGTKYRPVISELGDRGRRIKISRSARVTQETLSQSNWHTLLWVTALLTKQSPFWGIQLHSLEKGFSKLVGWLFIPLMQGWGGEWIPHSSIQLLPTSWCKQVCLNYMWPQEGG